MSVVYLHSLLRRERPGATKAAGRERRGRGETSWHAGDRCMYNESEVFLKEPCVILYDQEFSQVITKYMQRIYRDLLGGLDALLARTLV